MQSNKKCKELKLVDDMDEGYVDLPINKPRDEVVCIDYGPVEEIPDNYLFPIHGKHSRPMLQLIEQPRLTEEERAFLMAYSMIKEVRVEQGGRELEASKEELQRRIVEMRRCIDIQNRNGHLLQKIRSVESDTCDLCGYDHHDCKLRGCLDHVAKGDK